MFEEQSRDGETLAVINRSLQKEDQYVFVFDGFNPGGRTLNTFRVDYQKYCEEISSVAKLLLRAGPNSEPDNCETAYLALSY